MKDHLTVDSLIEIAEQASVRYGALCSAHPPGTFSAERSDASNMSKNALACAVWLDQSSFDSQRFVGPFGTVPFSKGDRVVVAKGALVRSTAPGWPAQGKPLSRQQVVLLHRVSPGFVFEDRVTNPSVTWAGAGGYWRWTDANNVTAITSGENE